MAKSNIIRGLANNEITVELAFNNLLLAATVINNKELLRWVEHEISGYGENDNVPIYRKNQKSLQFIYSGISGNYPVNNSPMPFTYFSEEVQNIVTVFSIYEGVKIMERYLALKDDEWSLFRDCTQYANDVYMKTGIQCFNISQVLQKSHYEKVYNTIKFTLTKVLLLIERWFGTLDTTELETRKFEKQRIFDASREITAFISGLYDGNKMGIPNPRITIPNAKPGVGPQQANQSSMVQPMQQPVQPQMQQPMQSQQMQQPMQSQPMQQPMQPQPMMPQMQQPMQQQPMMSQMQQQPMMPQMQQQPMMPQMQQQPMMPQMQQQPMMPQMQQQPMMQPMQQQPMMSQMQPVSQPIQPQPQPAAAQQAEKPQAAAEQVIITPPPANTLAVIPDNPTALKVQPEGRAAQNKQENLNGEAKKSENTDKNSIKEQ